MKKQFPRHLNLPGTPKFIGVHLPKDALLLYVDQRGGNHLALAIPEGAASLAVHGDPIGESRRELIEVLRSPVVADPPAVQLLRDPATVVHAPGGVVFQVGDPLHDVPVPFAAQLAEHLGVVAYERLPVQHDGEEMDRERLLLTLEEGIAVADLPVFPDQSVVRVLEQPLSVAEVLEAVDVIQQDEPGSVHLVQLT